MAQCFSIVVATQITQIFDFNKAEKSAFIDDQNGRKYKKRKNTEEGML
jgi:hypothetical protein